MERAQRLCLLAFPDTEVLSVASFGEGIGYLSLMHICELKEKGGCTFRVLTKESPPPEHPLHAFTAPVHEKELQFYRSYGSTDSIQDSISEAVIVDNSLVMRFLEGFSMPEYLGGLTNPQVKSLLKTLVPIHALHWTPPDSNAEYPNWLLPGDREFLISLYHKLVSLVCDGKTY